MAFDPDATSVTFSYDGGNAVMTRGLAKYLFGFDWRNTVGQPKVQQVQVKAHTRVRVIGQPSTPVAAHGYTFKRWPAGSSSNAAAGQLVTLALASGEAWTCRVSGSMAAFTQWFQNASTATGVQVISQRGTKYGPFGLLANP